MIERRRPNILVVNPDPATGELFATHIRDRWQVEPLVSDGYEAALGLYQAELDRGHRVDVAIVDYDEFRKRDTKGFVETLMQIAHERSLQSPRVIAAGGREFKDQARIDLGTGAYIPIPPQDDFGSTINEAIDQVLKQRE